MEERKTESRTKERYVPPKILASYSKKELEETIRRSGLHGGGGCGCTGGSIQDPWGEQGDNPLP
jgi:NADH:ubiquinone oxidoreductase subunit F (NADH-binding)